MRHHGQMNPLPSPQFNITGGETEDGWVRLIASRDLRDTQLEMDAHWPEDDAWSVFPSPAFTVYTLSTQMHKFIMVDAPDYPAAFRGLMEAWARQDAADPSRPQVPWTRAIGDGT